MHHGKWGKWEGKLHGSVNKDVGVQRGISHFLEDHLKVEAKRTIQDKEVESEIC